MKTGSKHTLEAKTKISVAHKGKKFSEDHKANMSKAQKGNTKSPEHRAKISLALKGQILSDETKVKMSIAQRGKIRSKQTREKMSIAKRGPLAYQWMGGISKQPWSWDFNLELKEKIRERDGKKCQLCGVPQIECYYPLAIHHVDYDKKNSDASNLIALCHSCHGRTNTNRNHWKKVFQVLLIEKTLLGLKKGAK